MSVDISKLKLPRTAGGRRLKQIDPDVLACADAMLKQARKDVSLAVRPRFRLRVTAWLYNLIMTDVIQNQSELNALMVGLHRGDKNDGTQR